MQKYFCCYFDWVGILYVYFIPLSDLEVIEIIAQIKEEDIEIEPVIRVEGLEVSDHLSNVQSKREIQFAEEAGSLSSEENVLL